MSFMMCAAARKWGKMGGFKIGAVDGGGKWRFPAALWIFAFFAGVISWVF